MDSVTKSFDEEEWVVRVSRNLDEELEEDQTEVAVSIFNVPKPLLIRNPHSFVPQQLAIGPCNYSSLGYCEMERYKVAAAKKAQKIQQNNAVKFHDIVDQFKKHDERIRAHYQKYLSFHCDTLAWIMALDTCFLLEFLHVFAVEEGKDSSAREVPSAILSHLIDYAGTKSAHNAIIRDVVMLDNQIPLFLLRKVLEFQSSSLDSADEQLILMLRGFCREISPFKLGTNELPDAQLVLTRSSHVLDVLYHTIVPRFEGPSNTAETDEEQDEVLLKNRASDPSVEESSNVGSILDLVWKFASNLSAVPGRVISKPIKVISKLPWTRISNMFSPLNKEKAAENENINAGAGGNFERPPLVEHINIPSVTELSKAGVRFAPTYTGGIFSIKFDGKTNTFHLPVITLDINSEVVLRNLVAYESCIGSGPLVLTRYTELMNGIINTDEDVKILRQKGIVVNHLKNDKGVTKMWSGMSRSIRLTKVELLDKTIADLNKYYNGRLAIKFKRFVTLYVFESWKFLTLLGAILMLLFSGAQAFCSVYSCSGVVNRLQHLN